MRPRIFAGRNGESWLSFLGISGVVLLLRRRNSSWRVTIESPKVLQLQQEASRGGAEPVRGVTTRGRKARKNEVFQ